MKGEILHVAILNRKVYITTRLLLRKTPAGFFILAMAVAVFLFPARSARARTIHVPADSATIQAGLDGALAGDTVLVADGVYTGEGNKNLDFLGKTVVLTSEHGPEVTIIDCQGSGRGFYFHTFENSYAKVEGFGIIGGHGSPGGGIYLTGSSSPTISRCIITANEAWPTGGGIYCGNSSPIISNCNISGNTANSSDEVAAWGGGIYISERSNPLIVNCIIFGNRVRFFPPGDGSALGGGVYCDGSAEFINCNIYGNFSTSDAGGIYCQYAASTFTNCIVWENQGTEIEALEGSPVVEYSAIQGDWPGEGNIDEDPRLRDPHLDNFHLMAVDCGDPFDSPCIDAGDPNIFDDSLDCWHGLGTSRSDMGAYGGANAGWPTAVEGENSEAEFVPKDFALFQNYPNPFNSETVLRFRLAGHEFVNIIIYNILGQQLKVLVEEYRPTGKHSVAWDASGFPSGIYFARLEAGEHSQTVKMVLLR